MTGTFRVLDLTTTLAGAYCGHLLSSGGIDVVRAEPPGGHPLRAWSASGAAIPDGASGALFSWLAGGQESVTVDPASPSDVESLLAWAATMDAVLWSRGAPVSVEQLGAAAPDTTVTAITPFGLTGPWADRAATDPYAPASIMRLDEIIDPADTRVVLARALRRHAGRPFSPGWQRPLASWPTIW